MTTSLVWLTAVVLAATLTAKELVNNLLVFIVSMLDDSGPVTNITAGLAQLAATSLVAGQEIICLSHTAQTYYVDVEGLKVTYVNPKYYKYLNATARRFGRSDPIHYVHVHGETLVAFGNNASVDVYVFEFLSNEYRRGFVEMHYKVCDLVIKDHTFGPYLNKNLPKVCPIPKGAYHLVNMSIPDLPLLKTFPFTKGRLYANTSLTKTKERIVEAYIDVVIKQRWR